MRCTAYATLRSGMLEVRADAEKYVLLAHLHLVERIAFSARLQRVDQAANNAAGLPLALNRFS
jgi:hypothetical protein